VDQVDVQGREHGGDHGHQQDPLFYA
jgi:hypothetical protein